jgi:hypothetical protein
MKFYWFDDSKIRRYLKVKFSDADLTEHDFGNEAYKKLAAINRCFSSRPWGLQHDISGHVPHHFNIKTKNAYRYQPETRSFGEICLDVAGKIAAHTDRSLAVFWSGGIDSTAVLVAMMQTVAADRLAVICNQASIDEFPSFYEQKIKDRVRTLSPTELHQTYSDYFSVSGDGGDTVWAVIDESFWAKDQHRIHVPWQDCIDRNIIDDIDFIEEFCSWSGVDIKTWLELRAWFYLCCKWQDKCMRPYWLRTVTDSDAVAFYDFDASFLCWTMNNLDQMIGARWTDYKIPAKQFIYQYHKDTDYLQNKSKVDSDGLHPDLQNKANYRNFRPIAVTETFARPQLPSWPFFDCAEFEDFNDAWNLIPRDILQ